MRVRQIDGRSTAEIELVARRMRETLVEVLGAERGGGMYTIEWLIERVYYHLDPGQVTGAVYVAEDERGEIVGHTIVRLDDDGEGGTVGLFSTTYVAPEARRTGVARLLLKQGEEWMRLQGMRRAVTYTDEGNEKLQRLYVGAGYRLTPMPERFVQLEKEL